ncbi:MAG: hypothetical protein IKL81_03620 [Clostridia bacterium]|nr:hypothetical protein [Clostridia bacterium]
MSESKKCFDLSLLKDNFTNIKKGFRPAAMLKIGNCGDENRDICSLAFVCKELNFGAIAPFWTQKSVPAYGSEGYYSAYSSLLSSLEKEGMTAVFCDDCDFPSGWAGGELCEKYPEYTAKHLKRYEYSCTEGNRTKYRLKTAGKTMSLVAFEEDTNDILDLRSFVNGEYLEWDTPEGNWTVQQYCCERDDEEKYVNYLNYDASMAYVSLTYKRFAEHFEEHIGKTVKTTFYNDIQFRAQNRRMWDESFNEHFEKKYGYDPAPYYPVLYADIAQHTEHYRAAFFSCRTDMLLNGFFKAVSDFAKSVGLIPMGDVAEAKTTSAPFIFGDGMKFQSLNGAVGIDLMHRYMYGFNGLKIASSASYNYDIRDVVCEIFGDYNKFDEIIVSRETMNAYARGVTKLIVHLPSEIMFSKDQTADFIKKWSDYASRCQTLLSSGRHVCDIAMLYPIHSLEAQSALFESPTSGFEYPYTPTDADYMNLINSVMNYCGHDLTVLHPEVFNEKCRAEKGILYLDNAYNAEEYSVLIVPGTLLTDLASLKKIKEFFLSGGKVIATSKLPSMALEFNPDECQKGVSPYDSEVKQLVYEIFGVTGGEESDIEPYYHNSCEKGGEAYFIPTSLTAADGTYVSDDKLLRHILCDRLDIRYDVEIYSMPRVSGSGILSLPRPMYIDIDTSKFAGGVFNHIHKKCDGYDVYFFANSTNADYKGKISLRGSFASCEIFDPHTGNIALCDASKESLHGTAYTSLNIEIPSSSSLFIVAKDEQ